MLAFISLFFRTIIIINLYKNLLNQKLPRTLPRYSNYLLLTITIILSTFFHINSRSLSPLISILLFTTYSYITYKNRFDLSFIYTSIAYAIYYVISNTISFLVPIFLLPFFYLDINIPYLYILVINNLITILVTHSLFKIKRLRSGFPVLASKKFINISMTICLLVLIIKTVDCLYIRQEQNFLFLPLATILLALLLFTWWQKQITKSYIEKLRKLEVQSLYDELEEKERQIQKLVADNESLSRIIHKDNKLIPAMENAVINFLSTEDFHNPDKLKQYGLELTQKLQDMTRDRRGILNSYDSECHNLRLTGHVSLDAILVYMQKKADANHIIFECRHTPETIDYLLTKISEDDLTHLLSDLMENAIISMRKQGNGRLQITFGKLQKEAYISIADSGIPFDIATLHSFGLQPHTTHKDSGGSGIGLMDIWKIKRKYRATIQIQEYEKHTTNFTKRILFSFNAKNHYVIQSFRHAEISNTQTRGDLYIIPAETKEKNEGKKHERNTENLNS